VSSFLFFWRGARAVDAPRRRSRFVIAVGIGMRRPIRKNYRNCVKRWGPLPCCPDVRHELACPATPPEDAPPKEVFKRPVRPSAAAASYFTPDTPPSARPRPDAPRARHARARRRRPPPPADELGEAGDASDLAPLHGENPKVTPHIQTHVI